VGTTVPSKEVWVYADARSERLFKDSLGIAAKARALAESLGGKTAAMLLGSAAAGLDGPRDSLPGSLPVDQAADRCARCGIDRVYLIDHPGLFPWAPHRELRRLATCMGSVRTRLAEVGLPSGPGIAGCPLSTQYNAHPGERRVRVPVLPTGRVEVCGVVVAEDRGDLGDLGLLQERDPTLCLQNPNREPVRNYVSLCPLHRAHHGNLLYGWI